MKRFCINASVFLGMNSSDEHIRVSCKNFFIKNINAEILISLEQVGFCDNIIWSYSFELQSLYYPFMDLFHTIMPLNRLPYSEKTISGLKDDSYLQLHDRLNIAFAKEHNSNLFTLNNYISSKYEGVMGIPILSNEQKFSGVLENYYQNSLQLRTDYKCI